MKILKKSLLFLLLAFILFVGYLFINTLGFNSKQISVTPVTPAVGNPQAIDHFAEALKIRTVSPEKSIDFDSLQFGKFNHFLAETYPLVDSLLDKKIFNSFSHLYKWQGSDSDLKPIILMGHLDVVPVIEKNLSEWKVDPWAGTIRNDTIWGRGTIDDKVGVVGIMEAVEQLLSQNFKPKRTMYFAFGHDEEIGGRNGAVAMANYLQQQGVKAEYVLDEGGVISEGLVPDMTKEVALIGTAEKGYLSLNLNIRIEGGHSSMPGKETAIDVMSNAITALKNNPLPAKITIPLEQFMEYLGPEMPFLNKMVFANKSVLGPILLNVYESTSSGNAQIRTTTSPTIFNSGVKDNIIPMTASATVNFRILPETTSDDVIAHVKRIINDDRITITKGSFVSEPSKLSATDNAQFNTLNTTILQLFPEVIVTPYLVVGGTDSRHYGEVTDNIYRFSPIHLNKHSQKSFHGLNERVAVSDFYDAIAFYVQLIQNSNQ
ncbi:MAG: M20 family peptidase [Maribacter sp.]